MRFNELKIGDQFEFWFDLPGGYSYEKIGNERVKCLSVPRTEPRKYIGQEYMLGAARNSMVRLLKREAS